MMPKDLKFTKTHEWVKTEGNIITIGLTEFAVQQLSDLVYIDLPKKGSSIKKDDSFGEVESVKAVSELYSPVTGLIEDINESLSSNLDSISKDPYGAGWIVKIKISNISETNDLLSADDYNNLCESEQH